MRRPVRPSTHLFAQFFEQFVFDAPIEHGGVTAALAMTIRPGQKNRSTMPMMPLRKPLLAVYLGLVELCLPFSFW
jgi:hypothetical protein